MIASHPVHSERSRVDESTYVMVSLVGRHSVSQLWGGWLHNNRNIICTVCREQHIETVLDVLNRTKSVPTVLGVLARTKSVIVVLSLYQLSLLRHPTSES